MSYIEGNRDHPVNKGVLCAKGASGIMQVTAPTRLRAPLRRVGPRGSGAFEEISWDEAMDMAVSWLKPLRETAPEKLAFFTGRDQSQSLTGWWAQAFGTPNYAAHGGFCSVNMAAGGIYTIGGAFWEFGQPDWERTKLFVLFGVAEDHDSNPIKIGLGKLKGRGARVVGVNPIRTGYNAVADDWYGITPGTDGLLILSLIHCLLQAGKVDLDYLAQFTNAPLLVIEEGPEKGLILKNAESQPFVIDRRTGQPAPWDGQGVEPDLGATYQGNRTVFQHMAERYLARGLRARGGGGALRHCGGAHPGACGGAGRCGVQSGDRDCAALDGFPRQSACDDAGPPCQFPRHARDFGAFEWLSDRARAASVADRAGHGRGAGGLSAEAAISQTGRGASDAAFCRRAGQAAVWPASGLCARAGEFGAEGRWQPCAHRQGVHLGEPAFGAWADAYADPECACGRPLPHRHAVLVYGEHGVEFVDEFGAR